MRKILKLSFTFLIIAAFLISFVGCQKTELEKINLAEVTRSVFYAPQYIALEKGFFEEVGLDVELTTTWGGDKTMTALLTDGADIALVGSETSIYVYAQEATDPVINFSALTQTDGTFLVARDIDREFAWEDLDGSIFLGQRKGGMPQMAGEYALKNNGIDPHEDLELIQNIDFANIPTAFASGTGDFVQLFEPTASQFELDGLGKIVASFGTESGVLPYTSFMAKESYLENNKETIEKFTKAVYKAQQWVNDSEPIEVAKALQAYFDDTELELLEASIKNYQEQGSYAQTPLLSKESWQHLQDIMDEAGELPERIDYEKLVNTSFAEEVLAD